MKGRRSVIGRSLSVKAEKSILIISETCYEGWLDDNGTLWLTACCGKIRSVKTESVLRAHRRAA